MKLKDVSICFKAAVPNLFGTRDRFRGRQFFHGPGEGVGGGWFWDRASTLHSSSSPAVQPSSGAVPACSPEVGDHCFNELCTNGKTPYSYHKVRK